MNASRPWNSDAPRMAGHGGNYGHGSPEKWKIPAGCAMHAKGEHCEGKPVVYRIRLVPQLPSVAVQLCAIHVSKLRRFAVREKAA